jgi:hypothetical protein
VADKPRAHGLIDGVVSLEEAMRRLRSESMDEKELATAKAAQEKAEGEAKAELEKRQKVEAEAASLKLQLQSLQSAARKTRFATEAKEVGAPEAFGEVLDAIEGAAGEAVYGQLTTPLKAFAAQLSTTKLFEVKGNDATPTAAQVQGSSPCAGSMFRISGLCGFAPLSSAPRRARVPVSRHVRSLTPQHRRLEAGRTNP